MASIPRTGSYFKEHWDDTYPQQQFLPEVYYPKEHVTYFPWGECDESKDSGDFKKIYDISHITHKRNVVEMGKGTHYCFRPKKKYGKCGYEVTDGSPLGESYRCDLTHIKIPTAQTRYTPVTQEQAVLDGYYSWWGTSTSGHDSSMYGSEKLTTNFKSALGTYKFGLTHDLDADVFLRVGGTLRYKKEICYVIIVHTEAEATDEIKRLPPLCDSDHFRLNGFLDEDGRVDWKSGTVPEFISRSYGACTDYFTFAFYFNDCDNSLRFNKEKVRQSQLQHSKCVRKFKVKLEHRPNPAIEWYCPEDERLPKGYSQEELVDNS